MLAARSSAAIVLLLCSASFWLWILSFMNLPVNLFVDALEVQISDNRRILQRTTSQDGYQGHEYYQSRSYSHTQKYQHSTALFGPDDYFIIGQLSLAYPEEACVPLREPHGPIEGTILLVKRGNCTFWEKTIIAQEYGAIGVIIGNHQADAQELIKMVGDEGQDELITIPSVFVKSRAYSELRAAVRFGGSAISLVTKQRKERRLNQAKLKIQKAKDKDGEENEDQSKEGDDHDDDHDDEFGPDDDIHGVSYSHDGTVILPSGTKVSDIYVNVTLKGPSEFDDKDRLAVQSVEEFITSSWKKIVKQARREREIQRNNATLNGHTGDDSDSGDVEEEVVIVI